MKKIFLLTLAAALVLSCETTEERPEGKTGGKTKEATGSYNIRFYRDPKTQVEYVLYGAGYGCAITPRLNADGTPYTAEMED